MTPRIAVVIPCYKVRDHILDVLARIGPEVSLIVAVDDKCPAGSGRFIEENCRDPRVSVRYNEVNLGVGGAVLHGYRGALEGGADICVKVDGDGQMDPALIPQIVAPIVNGIADYSKGNRFYYPEDVRSMPAARLFGNAALSFMTKLSSGYWSIFDPTNGYTAIHRAALERLPLHRIDHRYFFESDMLFRLYLLGAVVLDVPMTAVYKDEKSNLKIRKVVLPFLFKNLRNFGKRIFYGYFLRDLNIASLELVAGLVLLSFGLIFGVSEWIAAASRGEVASPGTVMLAGLPVIAGLQLLLGFLAFDYASAPRVPLQSLVAARARRASDVNQVPDLTVTDDARVDRELHARDGRAARR
jgi:dolichol-phosphate mannosyltransferase